VKKLRKSVNICQSYHKNKRVSFFYGPHVYSWLTVTVVVYCFRFAISLNIAIFAHCILTVECLDT